MAQKRQPSPNSLHSSFELEGKKCGVNWAKAVTSGPPYGLHDRAASVSFAIVSYHQLLDGYESEML